ncbi:hypothetical protein GBA52_005663 [Prunus armeniaca]|nr:hypothetical protein GBA52_005663 [Prunus armeniaca]
MRRGMCISMLSNFTQEPMYRILQHVLQEVSMRSIRHIWTQGRMSMLQQLEDQGRRPQVPMKHKQIIHLPNVLYVCENKCVIK